MGIVGAVTSSAVPHMASRPCAVVTITYSAPSLRDARSGSTCLRTRATPRPSGRMAMPSRRIRLTRTSRRYRKEILTIGRVFGESRPWNVAKVILCGGFSIAASRDRYASERLQRGRHSHPTGLACTERGASKDVSSPNVPQYVEDDPRAEPVQPDGQLAHIRQAFSYCGLVFGGAECKEEAAPAGAGHFGAGRACL